MRLMFIILLAFTIRPSFADEIYHNPPSENRAWPYTSELPGCDDFYVLRKIMHDFEKGKFIYYLFQKFYIYDEIVSFALLKHLKSFSKRLRLKNQ